MSTRLTRVTLTLVVAAFLLSGCLLGSSRSAWEVKITSAKAADEWDEFYMDADSSNYMIVIEIEFRNMRQDAVQFSPESVVLVHTGAEETGWGQTPALHKSGSSTQITDFYSESVMYSVAGGESRADTFVFEFPRGYTEFLLYFPETAPIVINVGS